MQCFKKNENYLYLGWIIIAGLFLFLFSPYTTPLNDYYGYDTALWNVIGKGITQGKVPYRDLFDHKGPLLFFIYAFQWLFEQNRIAMFLLQWTAFAVTVCYLYRVARLFTDIKRSIVGVFFFLFLFCGTISEGAMSEEWSLPFIVVTIFYALDFLQNKSETRKIPIWYGFLFGLCFGLVAMIRLNNAAPICGVVLALIIILLIRKEYFGIVSNGFTFICGMLIAILPINLWFWSKDALNDLWWGAFLFNFRYAMGATDVQTPWEMIRPWLMAAPIFLFIIMLYKNRMIESTREMKEIYFTVGITGIVTSITLLFGLSFFHYYTIILPLYMILFCMIIKKMPKETKREWLLLTVTVLIIIVPFTWQSARNVGKSILLNTQGWYDKQHDEIREFMSQIPEEERDSVWGNGSSFSKVYCVADITPCFPYFDNGNIHYQTDSSMNDKTVEMFETKPPKWIVVATVGESKIDCLQGYITEMYDLEDVLEGEKYLQLYRLRK